MLLLSVIAFFQHCAHRNNVGRLKKTLKRKNVFTLLYVTKCAFCDEVWCDCRCYWAFLNYARDIYSVFIKHVAHSVRTPEPNKTCKSWTNLPLLLVYFHACAPLKGKRGRNVQYVKSLASFVVCRRLSAVVVCNTPCRACRRLHPRRPGDDVMPPPI